jgi:hypothetical protein
VTVIFFETQTHHALQQPIEQYDTQLVELPSNPKAVKKAA